MTCNWNRFNSFTIQNEQSCCLLELTCLAQSYIIEVQAKIMVIDKDILSARSLLKRCLFLHDIYFCFLFWEINADSHKNSDKTPFRIKKLNILPLVIYMVHDYSYFGSTADFVIKKEHLGFLPDFAISKRRVEIWP